MTTKAKIPAPAAQFADPSADKAAAPRETLAPGLQPVRRNYRRKALGACRLAPAWTA